MSCDDLPTRFSGSVQKAESMANSTSTVKRFVQKQVPDSILHNEELNRAIESLPRNYNFEVCSY